MLLSIIVPAYNVAPYVMECLQSCVCQDLPMTDYEVILINDGSTDDTLEIVHSFVKEKSLSNIKVYSQSNRGLSGTRNRGMELASGDYIWFVDSDDYIEPNCLGRLKTLMDERPDIVVLSTRLMEKSATRHIDRALQEDERLTGLTVYQKSYVFPYSGVPFYIFSRDFLNEKQLRFKENVYFEDMLFTPVALSLTDNCRYWAGATYYYRIRENSITTSVVNEKKVRDLLSVSHALYEERQRGNVLYDLILKDSVCRVNESLLHYYLLKSERSVRRRYLAKMSASSEWKECKDSTGVKHRVYYYIFELIKALGF